MNRYFSPFLALRYLKPKRSFVSIITLISVLGVALGVAVLVVVISVFTGYGEKMRETILASQPHIVVGIRDSAYQYGPTLTDIPEPYNEWPNVVEIINEVPGVLSVMPSSEGTAIIEFSGSERPVFLQAIDPPEGPALERLRKMVGDDDADGDGRKDRGEFDLSGQGAVVGDALADALGLRIGDTFTVTAPDLELITEALDRAENAATDKEKAAIINEISDFTLPLDLEVTGVFDSGHHHFDVGNVFVSLEIGQELFGLGPETNSLYVEVGDPLDVEQPKEQIMAATQYIFPVQSWMDLNRQILDAVAYERFMMYFLLSIIMIVAGFCIMNTMITVIYQKRAEIGLLKAVGASENHIVRLFLAQGVIVGIVGVISGLVLAFVLIGLRNEIIDLVQKLLKSNPFDPRVYGLEGGLPAKVTLADCLVISLGSFAACALASLVPAWIAARMEPAEALRSE